MKAAERLQIRFTRSSVIVYKAVAELVELKHGDELFGAILHDVNGAGNLYGQNKIDLLGTYEDPVRLNTTNRSNRSAAFLHTALKGGNAIMIGDFILTKKESKNNEHD